MAIKEEIFYDSADGKTKIHAFIWRPEIEIKGLLQIAHGMLEHIDRYSFCFFKNSFSVTSCIKYPGP